MMINSPQPFSAAKMLINGKASANEASAEMNSYQRLMRGIRINGAPVKETAAADQTTVVKESANTEAAEETPKAPASALEKFGAEMTTRLQAANPADPQAAVSLAESLKATAEEIKNKFGQDKANEFMSQILKATDGEINETKLSSAIGDFFVQFRFGSLAGTASQIQENLKDIQGFLNKGLKLSVADSELGTDQEVGLAANLNRFFGVTPTLADDGEGLMVKGFDSNFRRVAINVNDMYEEPEAEPEGGYFYVYGFGPGMSTGSEHITVDDETVQQVASFLRDVAGNEDAAAYVENGDSNDFLGSIATAMAILTQESGQEAAWGFQNFLNDNIADLMQADSGNCRVRRWGLTQDYANPDAPIPSIFVPPTDIKDYIVSAGDVVKLIQDKKHQGFTLNSIDKNGVGGGSTIDLNELYAQYVRTKSAATAGSGAGLNNPAGNLVDTTA
jgi:hypothetical protein